MNDDRDLLLTFGGRIRRARQAAGLTQEKLAHIAGVDRTYVGLNGTLSEERVNWIIIDDTVGELGGNDPLTPEQAFERAEELDFETVIADDHGLWVLHRDIPDAPACQDYLRY